MSPLICLSKVKRNEMNILSHTIEGVMRARKACLLYRSKKTIDMYESIQSPLADDLHLDLLTSNICGYHNGRASRLGSTTQEAKPVDEEATLTMTQDSCPFSPTPKCILLNP